MSEGMKETSVVDVDECVSVSDSLNQQLAAGLPVAATDPAF